MAHGVSSNHIMNKRTRQSDKRTTGVLSKKHKKTQQTCLSYT